VWRGKETECGRGLLKRIAVLTKEEQDKLVQHAYALIGGVAAGFSTVDFHLQFLLSVLITGKEASPQALLVLRQNTFAQKIHLLQELLNLNFPQEKSELRSRGKKLVSTLDTIRGKRNLYVHGYWLVNYQLIASTGGVRVSDTKWRYDRKAKSRSCMDSHDISLEELRHQIVATKDLFEELLSFIAAVREGQALQEKAESAV
jgi:hypothetical protein